MIARLDSWATLLGWHPNPFSWLSERLFWRSMWSEIDAEADVFVRSARVGRML